MSPSIHEKFARVLVEYSLGVKPKEEVKLISSTPSEPLFKELFKHILQQGAFPRPQLSFDLDEYEELFYSNCDEWHLDYISPINQ